METFKIINDNISKQSFELENIDSAAKIIRFLKISEKFF